MRKKLLVCMLLLAFTCSMASAQIITSVDRTRGTSGDRSPVGVFDKDTDPLASIPLQDGQLVYSDRDYPFSGTPAGMVGNEYVRTFNTDKDDQCIMVNYAVTTSEAAVLWVAIDDRWAEWTQSGGGVVFESQQEAVDLIVHTFAAPSTFVDTGMDIFIHENDTTDRAMSVFASTTELAAGTYDFKLNPINKNFYIIGAVPEPMTLTLLGLGGLALVRRKRKM